MKPISYFEFNRRRFMKTLRIRIESYLIRCDLYKTGNLNQARTAYKRIERIVNETLQKPIVFENNNIFLVITELELHNLFVTEFSDSIKNTHDIGSLKDRQIAFFVKQKELEDFLTNNFSNPKATVLPE